MSVDILPCPTYEGGSVFLNGFSDGPKPYEEVLTFLRKGTDMLKYGRLGAPKSHPFRLSNDMTELQWESKKGQVRRIPLKCICRLEQGQNSSVFRKYPKPESQHVSFSIHYADENKRSRTLDVICNSKHDYEMWYWGVQIIMHYPPTTFYSTPPQALPAARTHALSSTVSVPAVPQHRATPQPAVVNNLLASVRTLPTAGDRRPKATPKSKPMAASLDLMKSMRSSGATMGISQTDTRAQMGDLYAWGSLMVVEADEQSSSPGNPSASHESLRVVMQSNRPNLVGEANCVDVARVACAPRHAALITRNGELYTWGLGRDGNLGHGWCGNVPKPRLLTRMGGRGVRTVSCGEGASAAISAEQRLFMWGKGTAGQLGNGYAFPCAEPAPVVFPGLREDVKVLAVSCGPYHTAAITEGGLLYTWGNGLFGRLGHGSHRSEYRPRRCVDVQQFTNSEVPV
ncbi:hypothetical protein Vafri_4613 [Volvox africanus]|uniref:PH domain-containing protein n=1 Tax=Volvox africanus TaxID=51714 RepID=A0A8J4AV89_9CHLO|nr:hypothetical protein Vafri_4613 [Volvox africanus]